MKKLLITLSLIVSVFTLSQTGVHASSGTSVCETPPTVYDIYPDDYSLNQGQVFTLSVDFHNPCRHIVNQVVINGELYKSDDMKVMAITNGNIEGSDGYHIEIEMFANPEIIDGYISITHFQWVDMTNWLNPVNHPVAVNKQTEEISIMLDGVSNPDSPPDGTSEYYFNYSDVVEGYLSEDEKYIIFVTADGTPKQRIPVDSLWLRTGSYEPNTRIAPDGTSYDYDFAKSMYVNAVGDSFDFAVATPDKKMYYIFNFVKTALRNASESEDITDFSVDTAYDLILANDGLSDFLFNKATYITIDTIQQEQPEHVFPNDYMWIDGNFTKIITDDSGNPVYDDGGKVVINTENPNSLSPDDAFEPIIDVNKYVQDIVESIYKIFDISGEPLDGAIKLQKAINFIKTHWVLILTTLALFLTVPLWLPFLPLIISVFKTVFVILVSLITTFIKGLTYPILNGLNKLNKHRVTKET